jgi:hypothetical protein
MSPSPFNMLNDTFIHLFLSILRTNAGDRLGSNTLNTIFMIPNTYTFYSVKIFKELYFKKEKI